MAATNRCPRGSEGGDAVSDTPRTDAAAFGTDNETLNRLFWIRELPRYVVPVDFARILERELAAVTAERDTLRADLCTFAVDMERQLSASQQEARRLREALDKLHIVCETSKPEIYDWYLTDSFASDARQSALEALASTPAPVQK